MENGVMYDCLHTRGRGKASDVISVCDDLRMRNLNPPALSPVGLFAVFLLA